MYKSSQESLRVSNSSLFCFLSVQYELHAYYYFIFGDYAYGGKVKEGIRVQFQGESL